MERSPKTTSEVEEDVERDLEGVGPPTDTAAGRDILDSREILGLTEILGTKEILGTIEILDTMCTEAGMDILDVCFYKSKQIPAIEPARATTAPIGCACCVYIKCLH